jgi:uncharacterized membrane protein YidH (DUF202 family)
MEMPDGKFLEREEIADAIADAIEHTHPAAPPAPKNQFDVGVLQVVLAEKRTSLAVLRTGITIAVVPLSITTVLVTLSRLYDFMANLHFLIPMYTILTLMMGIAFYLMGRALLRIRSYDRMIEQVRRENPVLGRFLR